MILPECRWMWTGIETADSLVINAHKWLGRPSTARFITSATPNTSFASCPPIQLSAKRR